MRPRLALALLVGVALVVVAIAASGASPVPYLNRDSGPDDAPQANQAVIQPQIDDVGPSTAGGSLVAVFIVLIAAVLIMMIGMVSALRSAKRRRRGVGPTTDPTDAGGLEASDVLVRGARDALYELQTRKGGPPRDAVVFAWLRLEQAAADSGTGRQPHETPTEFTGALLARHHVDQDATGALRTVYQRARFGVDEVTEQDARTAHDALERIVHDLTPGGVR